MTMIIKSHVSEGLFYVEIPEAKLFILCGCPADSVKHLLKRGFIRTVEENGATFEIGPNAILLSDVPIQNGRFSNLSEFPVLQMFYRQGMLIPGHPKNTGERPLLIGSSKQVAAQLEYIYRGNYGLISEEELREAGLGDEQARELMRLKLKFAFGNIRGMDDLLGQVLVETEPVEIKNGASIRRLRLNVFEISYAGESVQVDLNLAPGAEYQPTYPLGHHLIKREYFSVVYSGEGDGWDINRPSMGGMVIFQGKVFLVDAGPNIFHSLKALGIGVNEIEGIFHTHAHDDHFCGLTVLMRADHRIKYYATPEVRASVLKKLAALLIRDEEEIAHYFEYNDLKLGQWNDIESLEVMPVFSPHPVECTVMVFRTQDSGGYKTYAHFADIVSLSVLERMVTEEPSKPGLTRELFDTVRASYLAPADIKKLDIGGGMIHGDAEDFVADRSGKIVLAHTANPLTNRQKAIGSSASFGLTDVLIAAHQDYVRAQAFQLLKAYFPGVPEHRLHLLLNTPLVCFNPESIILKAGSLAEDVHLVLTGQVERLNAHSEISSTISAGGMIGEGTALGGQPSRATCRAANHVQALRIPLGVYRRFIRDNGLSEERTALQDVHEFLFSTSLLGGVTTYPIQARVAAAATLTTLEAGRLLGPDCGLAVHLVKSGRVALEMDGAVVEEITVGQCFGESSVLVGMPCFISAHALTDVELYQIPSDVLADIPIVRWMLLELFERRLERCLALETSEGQRFGWREAYAIQVPEMDIQHQKFFQLAQDFHKASRADRDRDTLIGILADFAQHAARHFEDEEKLMEAAGYPGLAGQRAKHRKLLSGVAEFQAAFASGDPRRRGDFGAFLVNWITDHILTEDRRYGPFLNKSGLSGR